MSDGQFVLSFFWIVVASAALGIGLALWMERR